MMPVVYIMYTYIVNNRSRTFLSPKAVFKAALGDKKVQHREVKTNLVDVVVAAI